SPWLFTRALLSRLTQIGAAHFRIVGQVASPALERQPARLEHVTPLRDGQGHRRVLLDQQYGDALTVDGLHRLEDLLDQHRRQPPGGPLQPEQPLAPTPGPPQGPPSAARRPRACPPPASAAP